MNEGFVRKPRLSIHRRRVLLLVVAAVLAPAVLWVGPALVWRPLTVEGPPPRDGLVRIAGVEWRRLAIPFARLLPVGNDVDRPLDLRRVVGLVFFIDRGTYNYVTEGTIWFDRLGTY